MPAAARRMPAAEPAEPPPDPVSDTADMVAEMRSRCTARELPLLGYDDRLREDNAASLLGVAPETLRAYRAEGSGPVYLRTRGRISYRLRDLAEWLAAERATGAADDC